MVDVDVRVSGHLKEQLAWAVDKRLWVINAVSNSCNASTRFCKRDA